MCVGASTLRSWSVVPGSASHRRSVERCGRHEKSNGSGASVKTLIPHSNGDLRRTESQRTREMNCVGSPQSVQDSQLAGHSFDVGREFDRTYRGPEDLPFICCRRGLGFSQVVIATRRCESCADLGIGEPARQSSVARIPQRCCHVGSSLVEHEFDETARIEIDDRHLQRRCSPTISATGRFGFGRDRPPAIGRDDRAGRLITPSAVRRSRTGVESSATIRATGVPRSVMTTSLPSRAASIHRPR